MDDCNVSGVKRTLARKTVSEHHIDHDGDHMKVLVTTQGLGMFSSFGVGKQQDYEIGGTFSETELNGEAAEVDTKWDPQGDGIREMHRTKSVEYLLVRELEDEDTMVLNLESEKGTKAKRIYKRIE